MEVKTAFQTLAGILMIAVVIASVVVIAQILMRENIYIEECIPSEYTATLTSPHFYQGITITQKCGFSSGTSVYCEDKDTCIDAGKNLCCPTSKDDIKVYGNRCCKVVKA